jgi:hypothetical protein
MMEGVRGSESLKREVRGPESQSDKKIGDEK